MRKGVEDHPDARVPADDDSDHDTGDQSDSEANTEIFSAEREVCEQIALSQRNPELLRDRRRPTEE